MQKKKKEGEKSIYRLQRGADALDYIKQQLVPLSYKLTLIPATTPAILLSWTQSIVVSSHCPHTHTHAPPNVHSNVDFKNLC